MKLVLFDIDGTLLSARGAGKKALERAINDHFPLVKASIRFPLDGMTDGQIIRMTLEHSACDHPFDGSWDPLFVARYLAFLKEEILLCRHFEVLPGVRELLLEISRDANFRIGLATGNIQGGAAIKVERAALSQFFAFGGYGCDAECRTSVIQAAIRRGRDMAGPTALESITVIGDTPRDIIHGREAGARIIAVATGSYSVEELAEHDPDLVVQSLAPAGPVLEFLRDGNRD